MALLVNRTASSQYSGTLCESHWHFHHLNIMRHSPTTMEPPTRINPFTKGCCCFEAILCQKQDCGISSTSGEAKTNLYFPLSTSDQSLGFCRSDSLVVLAAETPISLIFTAYDVH